MIIPLTEKQKMLLNDSYRIQKTLFLVFLCFTFLSFSQEKKLHFLKPNKVGISFITGTENNFLFNDADYEYKTKIIKVLLSYDINTWKNIDIDFIILPQLRKINHQLLNMWFVTADVPNYQEKRIRFTQPKTMYIYGIQFGIQIEKKIYKRLNIFTSVNVGIATIDTETERLAKGFTFIENGFVGFSFKSSTNTNLFIGGNIGHVSNFNIKKPNSGYNQLGLEIGFSYNLK